MSAFAPETPAEIGDLCMGLLERDPARRLSGREVLDRLSGSISPRASTPDDAADAVFVGRESSLNLLAAAFAQVQAGRSVSVVVHGPSGMGKSALVQRFVDRLTAGPPVLVLRSRCHEHESIPYKGLDGVIDSITRHLASLPATDLAHVLPHGAPALARLFPVLRALGVEPDLDETAPDPLALRRKAFDAFCDLLGRLARRQPVVIDIDDFHWADHDSVTWLTDLLHPPSPPSLLTLIAFRSEELEAKPFLSALTERIDTGERVTLALGPLPDHEIAELVAALHPGMGGTADARPIDIARSSGGNPFLVEALTHHVSLGEAGHRQEHLGRDAVTARRDPARRIARVHRHPGGVRPPDAPGADLRSLRLPGRRAAAGRAPPGRAPPAHQPLARSCGDLPRSHPRVGGRGRGPRRRPPHPQRDGAGAGRARRRRSRGALRALSGRRRDGAGRGAGGGRSRQGRRSTGLRSRGPLLSPCARPAVRCRACQSVAHRPCARARERWPAGGRRRDLPRSSPARPRHRSDPVAAKGGRAATRRWPDRSGSADHRGRPSHGGSAVGSGTGNGGCVAGAPAPPAPLARVRDRGSARNRDRQRGSAANRRVLVDHRRPGDAGSVARGRFQRQATAVGARRRGFVPRRPGAGARSGFLDLRPRRDGDARTCGVVPPGRSACRRCRTALRRRPDLVVGRHRRLPDRPVAGSDRAERTAR